MAYIHIPATLAVVSLLCVDGFAQSRPTMEDPTAKSANLPTQKIGKDDLVSLSVYGAPEMSRTLRVQQDGNIKLPMANRTVKAVGLLPSELENQVAGAIKDSALLVDPLVTVTVTEYRSRPVSVVGSVITPVTFQAMSDTTLLEAIGRAGGMKPTAGAEILITNPSSGNDTVRKVLIRDLIDEAKAEANIRLEGGEQIRIPEAGKIFVLGNVKKPGVFPVPDASGTSVMKILALSEGLSAYASRTAYVYRRSTSDAPPQEIAVEIKRLLERKEDDFILRANDILYVPEDGRKRATFTTLEKVLSFGSATSAALIYGVMR